MPQDLSTKKVALIIAFEDFKDEEYFLPREILESNKVNVTVVSNNLGQAKGTAGNEVEVDVLLQDVLVEDYQAIVFIGGPGALKNLDNSESYQIAHQAVAENKILAAICIAPTILAKAGVLKNKQATIWSSALDKSPIKTLEAHGAVYQDKNVVIDGKIITANGPQAAQEFGQALVKVLSED